jgi:hypothetical protein
VNWQWIIVIATGVAAAESSMRPQQIRVAARNPKSAHKQDMEGPRSWWPQRPRSNPVPPGAGGMAHDTKIISEHAPMQLRRVVKLKDRDQ